MEFIVYVQVMTYFYLIPIYALLKYLPSRSNPSIFFFSTVISVLMEKDEANLDFSNRMLVTSADL